MTDPTNAELLIEIQKGNDAFIGHAEEDHRFQSTQTKVNTDTAVFMAETEGKLAKLDDIPTKEEIGVIVAASIGEYFKDKGKASFSIIVGTGILFASFGPIGAGIKYLLAITGIVPPR